MLIFLYMLALAVLSLFGISAVNHLRLVNKISKLKEESYPLLASMGKKLKAFTIEKSETVYICKTIVPDFFTRLISSFLHIIGLDRIVSSNVYKEYAYIICMHELLQKVGSPNYLINFEKKIIYRKWGGVSVLLSATAIYMYADTLSLFPTAENFEPAKPDVSKRAVYAQLIAVMITAFILMAGINVTTQIYSSHLVKNLTLQKEQILWSYIEDSVLKAESERLDILKAKEAINAVLHNIMANFPSAYNYNYRVMITDEEEINIKLYPAGAIVFTKGFTEELESVNEIEYVLLHIISHYENRDHLAIIKDKLMTLNFIAGLFGERSWIGRLLVWKSAFELDYSLAQEIQADEMALSVQNNMHGQVSGIDAFEQSFYSVTNPYNRIYNSHPFQVERKDAVNAYIQKHNLLIGQDAPLPFKIEKTQSQNKLSNETVGATDEYLDLFNKYRNEVNILYVEYNNFLAPFSNILNFSNSLTLMELNDKKSHLSYSIGQFDEYRKRFRNLLKAQDQKMRKFLDTVQDKKQRLNQHTMWNNEYHSVSNLMEFYLTRDQRILQEQLLIVNFLISRYGTYKVTKFGIEFLTDKEKSDYLVLQKRLDELIKQPPNIDIEKK